MEEKSYLNFFRINDELSARMSVAAMASIVYATARTVSGGTFYDLFAGVFLAFAVLAFTFLFTLAFEDGGKNRSALAAGRAAFLFSAVLATAEIELFSFSLGVFAAYAATLAMGYTGDGSRGAVAGLLMGAALGGENTVIFAFSGLAAGVFYELSPLLGAFAPPVVTACAYMYLSGKAALAAARSEVRCAALATSIL